MPNPNTMGRRTIIVPRKSNGLSPDEDTQTLTHVVPRPVDARLPLAVSNSNLKSARKFRAALYDDPILVTITGAVVRKRGTAYSMLVYDVDEASAYQVERRFSQFFNLRESVTQRLNDCERPCPGCKSLQLFMQQYEFPKRQFFAKEKKVVQHRAITLRGFIRELTHRAVSPQIIRCVNCHRVAEDVKQFLVDDGSQLERMTERLTTSFKNIKPSIHRQKEGPNLRPVSETSEGTGSTLSSAGRDSEEIYRFDLSIGSFADYLASVHSRDGDLLSEFKVTFKGWDSILDRNTGIAHL